jgi:hypothetical protein
MPDKISAKMPTKWMQKVLKSSEKGSSNACKMLLKVPAKWLQKIY